MLVESKVRTNKLYCSECGEKIKKGEWVIFELKSGRMINVYGEKCGCRKYYETDLIEDQQHPGDSYSLSS